MARTLNPAYGDGFAGVRNDSDPAGIYVRGDEFTDDSLRLVPEPRNDRRVRFENRQIGVWNSTGIQISGNSVSLGLDLSLSGAGRFLQTSDVLSGEDALVPHHMLDPEGSRIQPETFIVGPLLVALEVFSDDGLEVTGSLIVSTALGLADALTSRIYFKTGSIAATSEILFTIHRGPDTSGDIFFQQTLPASLLGTPETEFFIEVNGAIQTIPGQLVTSTWRSENTLSLKTNLTGEWATKVDTRFFSREEILTASLLLTNDLELVFSDDASLVRPNHVI